MLKQWSIAEVCALVNGQCHAPDPELRIAAITTDSRKVGAGDLYVALSGERFNGHDFIAAAAEQGAVAALVDQDVAVDGIALIRVADCLTALGELAGANRAVFTGPVISVTGSAGKTSVKQLMSSVLSVKYNTWMTQGNLNNHIGAPLSLLAINKQHEAAVIELGASGLGEIGYTAKWVKPQVGIITNAAEAHIEGFGSLEGIVQTKGELLDFIQPGGTAVLNADDVFYSQWAQRAQALKQISFGLSESADVRATDISADLTGCRFMLHLAGESVQVTLPLLGLHNVRNALAVAAAASAIGMTPTEIAQGLAAAEAVGGRLQWVKGQAGQRILNDAYNANPASMKAAVDVLKNATSSWLVIGDMAELGSDELALHADVGRYAREQEIKHLIATGPRCQQATEAFGAGAHWFATKEEVVRFLQQKTSDQDVILVKGSRSAGMDQVVHALRGNTEEY